MSSDSAEKNAWQQTYGRWNAENLETEGVMDVYGESYVYIHKSHPVMGLLMSNSEMLGFEPRIIDGNIHKISRQVLSSCCNTIRQRVLTAPSWYYGKWNACNLETEGVMFVHGADFLFVEAGHPVVAALTGGVDAGDVKTVEGYYKVNADVFYERCEVLRVEWGVATSDEQAGGSVFIEGRAA